MTDKKPREFWVKIIPNDDPEKPGHRYLYDNVCSSDNGTADVYHVIEYSAYEHAEKMKDSHWQSLMNSFSNIECLEKNARELLEEKATLKQIIKDYEEALKSLANEASALLYAHELALKEDHGNTNINCLTIRINTAKDVLKKHRGIE